MTVDETIAQVLSTLGDRWRRSKPIPEKLIAKICDALLANGVNPTTSVLCNYLPFNERAFRRGVLAWRSSKGFSTVGYTSNPDQVISLEVLKRLVSPEIATAPQTCLDPLDGAKWARPPERVLSYVGRIQNSSLRDAMSLYGLIRAGEHGYRIYTDTSNFVGIMRRVMIEQSIKNVTAIDPNDLLFRIQKGEVGSGLTSLARFAIFRHWTCVRNAFEDYAARLSKPQLAVMSRFFIRPITDRRKLAKFRPIALMKEYSEARVKAKTEAVHGQFHKLRYMATIRFNQVERLHQAIDAARARVEQQKLRLPYEFCYEETVRDERVRPVRQRVHLALWDSHSIFDSAAAHGYPYGEASRAQRRQLKEKYAKKDRYEVEYLRTESLEPRVPAAPFWFLELFDHGVFDRISDATRRKRREEFYRKWGYTNRDAWTSHKGQFLWKRDVYGEISFLQKTCGRRFLPREGIYLACLFANLMVRVQTVNGARLGEVQQIAQNPECIKQLVNVGPKASTHWLLRMVPKGRRERANYFIDEDTKNHIMKVIAFLRRSCGGRKIPTVPFLPSEKIPPDRYIVQQNGHLVSQSELSSMLRFLLHGLVTNPVNGKGVHLTSHLLRHALATEMANLKVSVDVVASILHQRDISVTKYYSRPTTMQVMESMESLFVDRVDIAAEALRSPSEIGRMLKDAEGKVGALSEVLGGTCTIGNVCAAKFACIGCAGNAPDPAKRHQVERKRAWAVEQARWSQGQQLYAEERQMKRLIQDCDLLLEEMRLIECARSDSAQLVQIQPLAAAKGLPK